MKKVYVSHDSRYGVKPLDKLAQLMGNKYELLPSTFSSANPGAFDHHELSSCITQTACTVLLIGDHERRQAQMDLEIFETLNAENGLIAFSYPNLNPNQAWIPPRLLDNLQLASRYASWHKFPESQKVAIWLINLACNTDIRRIRNSRRL